MSVVTPCEKFRSKLRENPQRLSTHQQETLRSEICEIRHKSCRGASDRKSESDYRS